MDTEPVNPLQSLVQSVTKQQQARSDLVNRLSHLTAQVTKCDGELSSLSQQEKTLRREVADIIRSNTDLEDRTASVIQNCGVEQQSKSSLALTLDSLNEKSHSLAANVSLKKRKTDEAYSAIQQKLDVDGAAVADLLSDPGMQFNLSDTKISPY